jgi:hypothetical protein
MRLLRPWLTFMLVISKNLKRRHLNESQRAMVARRQSRQPPQVSRSSRPGRGCHRSTVDARRSLRLRLIVMTTWAASAGARKTRIQIRYSGFTAICVGDRLFTQEYRVGAIAKRIGSAYPRSNIRVGGRNLDAVMRAPWPATGMPF